MESDGRAIPCASDTDMGSERCSPNRAGAASPCDVEEAQDWERHDVLRVFGRDVARMPSHVRAHWIDRARAYWRRRGFPFPRLQTDELEYEYRSVARARPERILDGDRLRVSMVGLRLANAFHPQMWSVPVRGHLRSPLENFADEVVLETLLKRAVRFWPSRRCWNAQCVRSLFRVYRGGRVSNFRPTAARAIVASWSSPGETVVDFSAGYGGRLLGALTLPRHYVGIDPDRRQVAGLEKMRRAIGTLARGTAVVHRACAEDALPRITENSVSLVFSSPPYFDVEKYSLEPTQSYVRYPTYDEWRERFLRTLIRHSHRILRPGGSLVLNVANVSRYPLATDAEEIGRSLFGDCRVIRMMMNAMPVQRAERKGLYRWEPVLVFRNG